MRTEDRKKIVEVLLGTEKPISTSQISQITDISRDKIYSHLTILEKAGEVERKKDGRVFWIGNKNLEQKRGREYSGMENESVDEEE